MFFVSLIIKLLVAFLIIGFVMDKTIVAIGPMSLTHSVKILLLKKLLQVSHVKTVPFLAIQEIALITNWFVITLNTVLMDQMKVKIVSVLVATIKEAVLKFVDHCLLAHLALVFLVTRLQVIKKLVMILMNAKFLGSVHTTVTIS